MKYDIYTNSDDNGKYKMTIGINDRYYTRIDEIGYRLLYLSVFDNHRDFINEMKKYTKRQKFTFNTEEQMNSAKEYIDSLFTLVKLTR